MLVCSQPPRLQVHPFRGSSCAKHRCHRLLHAVTSSLAYVDPYQLHPATVNDHQQLHAQTQIRERKTMSLSSAGL